ncbi:hypothetical protein Daesc_002138 [Daldinia eschscholtzii]|uniref:Uncharacterized protein n=1 Tax=Daldinia eschscholtzii TaxID=292717 RepID=A0AAX6MWS8_9PEZI
MPVHVPRLPSTNGARPPNTDLSADSELVRTYVESLVDDTGVDEYLSTLVRWNGTCIYQEVTKCAWREVPVAYIYTNADMTVTIDLPEIHGGKDRGGRPESEDGRAGHRPLS